MKRKRFKFLREIENKIISTISILLYLVLSFSVLNAAEFQINEDIKLTKHNLSANWDANLNDPRTVKAQDEPEICIFCHTPHASAADGPLWNRILPPSSQYSTYAPQITYMNKPGWETSEGSLDANVQQPQGYSKLCLSCHDGTIAIGFVRNAAGSGYGEAVNGQKIQMTGVSPDGTMPVGSGELSGDTRRLGIDLSNDHPVSMKLDDQLVAIDTELILPDKGLNKTQWSQLGVSVGGARRYPLGFTGNQSNNEMTNDFQFVQCTSCHNPHTTNEKFLRKNVYNTRQDPADPDSVEQICLDCHDKPGWLGSTHRTSSVQYSDVKLNRTVGIAGCLNCHDPHTKTGADRLHREGAAYSIVDQRYTPAIENTCYLCHKTGGSLVDLPSDKDIKTQFDKGNFPLGMQPGSAMPLDTNWKNNYEPNASNGFHQPVFVSKWAQNLNGLKFGEATLFSPDSAEAIHVECVDCHNPHEVKNPDNIAPEEIGRETYKTNGGRLEGMPGITIDGYEVGRNKSILTGCKNSPEDPDCGDRDPYVHEVCFRCHGDSYNKVMRYVAAGAAEDNGRATINYKDGLPVSGSNAEVIRPRGHYEYAPDGDILSQRGSSNKRREFDRNSPGLTRDSTGGPRVQSSSKNPSYHPVAFPGRNGTLNLCRQLKGAFPELDCTDSSTASDSLSKLTINCTDCHNNDNTSAFVRGAVTESNLRGPAGRFDGSLGSSEPTSSYGVNVQSKYTGSQAVGPHGSVNYRILRAKYVTTEYDNNINCLPGSGCNDPPIRGPATEFAALCLLCHDPRAFTDPNGGCENGPTNFGGGCPSPGIGAVWNQNLHRYHLHSSGARAVCHNCHNNVHSNIEANNTIYGDGKGTMYQPGINDAYCDTYGCLPSDGHDGIKDGVSDTHLLNFGPGVTGQDGTGSPRWFYDSLNGVFRCQLKCHGVNMNSCAYSHGITRNELCTGDPDSIFNSGCEVW